MTRLLLKLPWFLSAPAVIAVAVALALGANLALSSYFERSFLDEADPLASVAGSGGEAQPTAAATSAGGAPPSPPSPAATVPANEPTAAAPTAPASEPTVLAPEPTQPPADASGVLLQGEWRDGEPGHNGEGIAKILRTEDGRLVLRVEEFSVTNGPDLFVVLSPDAGGYADGSLNLGGLKATDGNFNYDIPEGADLSQYKSVVVWCRSFDITFAVATLEEV